jgi:hypothetical protein
VLLGRVCLATDGSASITRTLPFYSRSGGSPLVLYQPATMTASVEWEVAGETEVLEQNLSMCHSVHHKCHMARPMRTVSKAVNQSIFLLDEQSFYQIHKG